MNNELVSAEWLKEWDCEVLEREYFFTVLENKYESYALFRVNKTWTCEKTERILNEYGIQRKPKEPELKTCPICLERCQIYIGRDDFYISCDVCPFQIQPQITNEAAINIFNSLPRQSKEFPKYVKSINNTLHKILRIEIMLNDGSRMNDHLLSNFEIPTAAEIAEYEANK